MTVSLMCLFSYVRDVASCCCHSNGFVCNYLITSVIFQFSHTRIYYSYMHMSCFVCVVCWTATHVTNDRVLFVLFQYLFGYLLSLLLFFYLSPVSDIEEVLLIGRDVGNKQLRSYKNIRLSDTNKINQ